MTKVENKYGKAGDESNLVYAKVPFKLKLSWDAAVSVDKVKCHKLVKTDLENIFKDILQVYGLDKIEKLGINLFGGCYNYRNMRGGTKLSMHSWGIAIDLNPENNLLRWGKDKAVFAKPEYKQLIDIFYKHGWINLGVEKNYDWMHFEKKV